MQARSSLSPAIPTTGDWHFCYEVLPEVSRTFSEPILLLPTALKEALTVGYLLCRVADTIEDCGEIGEEQRLELLGHFDELVRSSFPGGVLRPLLQTRTIPSAERKLLEGLPHLLGALDSLPPRAQAIVTRWAGEMASGMAGYCEKRSKRDFWAPEDMKDLERYCYFVAGTVGHMVTDLFTDWHGLHGGNAEELRGAIEDHAESFGLGLQMVNVIKDITDDFPRGVCYIPRDICEREGISPEELLLFEHREAALRVTQSVIDRAKEHLRAGLAYVLLLPKAPTGLRLFCLLPLLFAQETLALAQLGPDRLIPGRPIKISRQAVGRIILDCGLICQDDAAITDRFERCGRVELK